MKKKAILMLAVTTFLATTILIGGTIAYLTDTKTATNTFMIGKVEIELSEPSYPGNQSDEVKHLVSNQVIKKDPKIRNVGKNDAIVFLEVDIPMANILTAKDDGSRNAQADTELFGFSTESGSFNSVDENWALLSTNQDNDARPSKVTRVYGYKTSIAPSQSTNTLFDRVRLANIIEGQVDEEVKDIDIRAYAIQATDITGNGITASDLAASSLSSDVLSKVYTIFINQNIQ